MIVLSESTGGMRVCDTNSGQSHDRRRKISYAIQEPEISRRRKHRTPQIVGLAFFLVLASVITVGLVFGIGPSDEHMKNETSKKFRKKIVAAQEIIQDPSDYPEPTESSIPLPTNKPIQYNITIKRPTEKVPEVKEDTCIGKEQRYRFGTVNSNSEVCSQQGLTILARHYGSVVDAALTTMLCLGVVHPHASGIGGGFFMLIYDRNNKTVHALDSRVAAPGGATRYMFEQKLDAVKQGHMSIATPGEIDGYWTAHQKFGKLPWRDLFTPAISLAMDGFPVSQQLSSAINLHRYKIHSDQQLKNLFIDRKTGNAVKTGDIIRNGPLATTLKSIAEKGLGEYHNGSIADNMVLELLQKGGSFNREDILNYRSKWRDAVSNSLKNDALTMKTMPLPGSGQLLTFITNILDEYYSNQTVDDRELAYHRLVESLKFAMARKLYLGDPDFVKPDPFVENLDSKDYARRIKELIGNITHDAMYYGSQKGVNDQGTSVVIVRNPDGDLVVATSTLGAGFGSGVGGSYTGIVYNNGMSDFDLPQTPPTFSIIPPDTNYIKGKKRPLSSMSPCIILDQTGDAVLAMASGGGPAGLSAQAITILRTLYMDMGLKEAIDSPFLYNNWLPPFTEFEPSLKKDIVEALKTRGHLMSGRQSAAFVNAVSQKHQFLYSYADVRKGGCVDGY